MTNKELLKLLDNVLKKEVSVIEASRILNNTRLVRDDLDDKLFYVFLGIDDETETIPVEEKRHLYSKSYLEKSDKFRDFYNHDEEVFYEIKNACEALILYIKEISPLE